MSCASSEATVASAVVIRGMARLGLNLWDLRLIADRAVSVAWRERRAELARDEGAGEMTFSAGTRSRNRHYLHDTLLICELGWTQLLGGVNGMVILASYIRSGQ
jgi:hypothetical protein